ncbi:MAG: DNA-binding response regulator [Verrucomicrobiota bacterium]
MQVLLIEDDPDLAAIIAGYPATREVECGHAYDGITGLHLSTTSAPDAINREKPARRVWQADHVEDETIRAHIDQLRQNADLPFDQPLIHTIRGYGHALKADNA